MSEQTRPGGADAPFGEQLLGIEGFSAVRAARYREEITQLLAHRVTRAERWCLAVFGAFLGVCLLTAGVTVATARDHPGLGIPPGVRLTFAATFVATGVLLGGWMLWVALKGGYGRRAGDVVGPLAVLLFGGGAGAAFIEIAWSTDDAALRNRMFATGALFLAVSGGCLLVAAVQRMHRQTQLKLLRIEYHVAELMERRDPPAGR